MKIQIGYFADSNSGSQGDR